MAEKILVGYTGSWAGNVKRILEGKKPSDGTPVYVSKEKYKKLQDWSELKYYSTFL